jgi:hypothetical protein
LPDVTTPVEILGGRFDGARVRLPRECAHPAVRFVVFHDPACFTDRAEWDPLDELEGRDGFPLHVEVVRREDGTIAHLRPPAGIAAYWLGL